MARISGVDLPKNKRVPIALTYIYGIGPMRGQLLCEQTGIDQQMRVRDLTDEQVSQLSANIQNSFAVEGDLRREVQSNIKRLMEINCYRGIRHKKGLPVRGQKTKTNARTRKGPRKVAIKKK
jgi:small subunit ribosomal protein S13